VADTIPDERGKDGSLDRFRSAVCQRTFSSPEAFGYEFAISPAVLTVASSMVKDVRIGSSVLDVGSGGGRLAAYLASDRACSVTCVDPSLSQVRRVEGRRRRGLSVTAVRGVADALPFAAATFDVVVSCCALKHWPDPLAGLRECARVLRPGGQLLLIEISGDASEEEFRRFTKLTRVPVGLRAAYVRFAMRTVVAVAPRQGEFERLLHDVGVLKPRVWRTEGLPFVVATAIGPEPVVVAGSIMDLANG
jgi:SAM-dependent methyltransferase